MIDHPCLRKPSAGCWLGFLFLLGTASVGLPADTHYVDVNSTNPVSPYTSWTTAARGIQDAIDVSTKRDTVLVTNGVYESGARAVYGMSNRVAVTKAVTVRSVNGPEVTHIAGYQVPGTTNGAAAVRCVYLTDGAVLAGFTLTNGATQTSGDYSTNRSGGGVWCESVSAVVSNCVLAGNSATWAGGAFRGTLNNCALVGNSANSCGGALYGTLNNSTLVDNSAYSVGGAWDATLNNCILYYNRAGSGTNLNYDDSSMLNYCCTTPLPSGGTGNTNVDPQLASAWHLSIGSPCRGAGSAAYTSGVDIDGELWATPPSIGCDEYWSGAVTGALSADIVTSYTNVAVGFVVDFEPVIDGRVSASRWDFGDGTVVSNRPYASHAWGAPGDYVVELRAYNESYPEGVSAAVTIRVLPLVVYVSAVSVNPVPPYISWATAARTIQEGVDAVSAGGEVVVSNGIYATGARAVYGMSNRVAVTKPLILRSVNGPEVTQIVGYQVPGTTNGAAAVRCAYLTNGAVLGGFTLTNGATQTSGDYSTNRSGGGVWCESVSAVVSNCVLTGNSATWGGGAFRGTLNNCVLVGNSAYDSGGVLFGTLNNCSLVGNSAYHLGGGAYSATLNNCTLTDNWAYEDGGGSYSGTLNNCIVYYNRAGSGTNLNYDSSTLNYCCTTPLPSGGTGNTNVEPQLASVWRLSAGSPCRGAGSVAYTNGLDMDGEPWANPPSIGCDEYCSGAVTGALSAAILVSYTNVAVGFAVDFEAVIGGRVSASRWDFGDGTVLSNRPYASHAWSAAGDYVVELRAYNESHPEGVSAVVTIRVQPLVVYVSAAGVNPVPPYISWATAARTIQEGVDAVSAGGEVVVSNGVYATGARVVYGMSNRVAVTKPVTVRSVNGPEVTQIAGYQVPGTINGPAAVRCVYLTNGAVLAGFTLTNGATQTSGDGYTNRAGGGVWCETVSAVVSNCVLTGNSAGWIGGGAYHGTFNNCTFVEHSATWGGGAIYGTLNNCMLTGNSAAANGGGTYSSTLNNCTLTGNWAYEDGGGASYGTLNNCTLTDNWAYEDGGGSYSGTLNNCTLTNNSASWSGGGASGGALSNCVLVGNSVNDLGGGAFGGTLNNCVLVGNSADYGGGAQAGTLNNCTLVGNSADGSGGGAIYSTLNNCIAYYNSAGSGSGLNYDDSSTLNYCCTTPLPSGGSGNTNVEPQLASAWQLSAGSPCRGAGSIAYANGVDIDGEPGPIRRRSAATSIGADR